jgi:hypothetical protein
LKTCRRLNECISNRLVTIFHLIAYLALFPATFCFKKILNIRFFFQGRYTRDIDNFRLTVPFKVLGNGEFTSFKIPTFYKQNFHKERRKRSLDDPEVVHYIIHLNGNKYQAHLWPNHHLVSPDAVFEKRRPKLKVQDRMIQKLDDEKMCHYTGEIKGEEGSRVALTTCDGLV